jgi:hypothetical protein
MALTRQLTKGLLSHQYLILLGGNEDVVINTISLKLRGILATLSLPSNFVDHPTMLDLSGSLGKLESQ